VIVSKGTFLMGHMERDSCSIPQRLLQSVSPPLSTCGIVLLLPIARLVMYTICSRQGGDKLEDSGFNESISGLSRLSTYNKINDEDETPHWMRLCMMLSLDSWLKCSLTLDSFRVASISLLFYSQVYAYNIERQCPLALTERYTG
jgi:hypothetical protein